MPVPFKYAKMHQRMSARTKNKNKKERCMKSFIYSVQAERSIHIFVSNVPKQQQFRNEYEYNSKNISIFLCSYVSFVLNKKKHNKNAILVSMLS